MGVSGIGELLDIQHGQSRVGDGLAEHRLGVGAEGRVQLLLGAIGRHEGEVNAHPLHGDSKQVVGAAIDGGGGHHVIATGGDVEHGIEGGRLTGGGQHSGGTALHLADLGRHRVVGGVLQAGVEIAGGFQVKQFAHILAGGVFEGGGLDHRDLAGLAVARGIAALYAFGFDFVVAHIGHPFGKICINVYILSIPPTGNGCQVISALSILL